METNQPTTVSLTPKGLGTPMPGVCPHAVAVASARAHEPGKEIANVGDFAHSNEVKNMTASVTVSPIGSALVAFVKANKSVETTGTSYLTLAVLEVINADDKEAKAVELTANMCATAEVVSAKGKANPQALKSAGFASLAEAARLLKKTAKQWDNLEVQLAAKGFAGVIPDQAFYDEALNRDERYLAAKESGDEKAIAKAEERFRNNFLNVAYEGRATSFSGYRSALDKATKPAGTNANEETSEATGEGTGETVSDNAAITSALSLAEKVGMAEAAIMAADVADLTAIEAELNKLMAAIQAASAQIAASDEAPMAAAA